MEHGLWSNRYGDDDGPDFTHKLMQKTGKGLFSGGRVLQTAGSIGGWLISGDPDIPVGDDGSITLIFGDI
jgi:hypothetical protein